MNDNFYKTLSFNNIYYVYCVCTYYIYMFKMYELYIITLLSKYKSLGKQLIIPLKGNCSPTPRDANEHQVGSEKSWKLCIHANIYVINAVKNKTWFRKNYHYTYIGKQ